MPEGYSAPAFLTPEDFDDTELGATVRAAYADGHYTILLLPPIKRCEVCERPLDAEVNCVACGDPDEDPEPRDLSL